MGVEPLETALAAFGEGGPDPADELRGEFL
jgi:hypothetical protein